MSTFTIALNGILAGFGPRPARRRRPGPVGVDNPGRFARCDATTIGIAIVRPAIRVSGDAADGGIANADSARLVMGPAPPAPFFAPAPRNARRPPLCKDWHRETSDHDAQERSGHHGHLAGRELRGRRSADRVAPASFRQKITTGIRFHCDFHVRSSSRQVPRRARDSRRPRASGAPGCQDAAAGRRARGTWVRPPRWP